MTENEAITRIREFGLYHAIGDLPNSVLTKKAFEMAIKALEEIQQYRSIGTVEECREAIERHRAKKPNKRANRYTDLVQHYYCPECGKYFGQAGKHDVILFDKPQYCTCGQAILWESDSK